MCMNCLSTAEATIAGTAFLGYAVKPSVHRVLASVGLADPPDPVAHDATTVRFLRSLELDPVAVLGSDVVTAADAWVKPIRLRGPRRLTSAPVGSMLAARAGAHA